MHSQAHAHVTAQRPKFPDLVAALARVDPAKQPCDEREGSLMHDHKHAKQRAYALLTGAFCAGLALLSNRDLKRRKARPEMVWADVLLLGVATHKVATILTQDRVTETVRTPFVDEAQQPKGTGLRRALGELITCPYCTAPWVAMTFNAAYLLSPRETRLAGRVFAMVTISDFINRGYSRLSGSSAVQPLEPQLVFTSADAQMIESHART